MANPQPTITSPMEHTITKTDCDQLASPNRRACGAEAEANSIEPARQAGDGPVAYIMSRFPKITETFVLYEILAVEQLGRRVEVYPLLRESAAVMHPEAEPLVRRAHYTPFLSWRVARSNCTICGASQRRTSGRSEQWFAVLGVA